MMYFGAQYSLNIYFPNVKYNHIFFFRIPKKMKKKDLHTIFKIMFPIKKWEIGYQPRNITQSSQFSNKYIYIHTHKYIYIYIYKHQMLRRHTLAEVKNALDCAKFKELKSMWLKFINFPCIITHSESSGTIKHALLIQRGWKRWVLLKVCLVMGGRRDRGRKGNEMKMGIEERKQENEKETRIE